MSLLLLMLITTAFWVVPNDSKNFEKLASDDETIRNEGAYEILRDFTDEKIKTHSENSKFKICIEKAKDFLDQILFAIKKSKVINLEKKKTNKNLLAQISLAIKKNVIRSEENKRWICAEEIPSKMKEALKLINERIFKIRKDENYSENIKKPFLMILSVAVRICAMIGSNNDELQTFLKAYKCSSEDQSERPPIMYSFGILPNYSEEIIGKLGHSASKISSISLNTDISAASKQNFNLLLKLSEIELTPFSILNLAKTIEFDLQVSKININFEHPTFYDLVIAHFYREYEAISSDYQVDFKRSDYFNLTNFMLQLMNRVKKSPNSSDYFVKAKFSTELEQKLGEFHQLKVEYSKNCEQNDVRKINEHQDFLHFAEAVHVNWNPYKELLIALKTFKYVYLCSETGLGYFGSIIERFDQKLLNDLVKEGKETEKDRELMIIIQINSFRKELDKLMPQLQTLENFKLIQQNYEKLLTFEELFVKRRCTENDDKNAFGLIVTLNDELEKAKTICMEKI